MRPKCTGVITGCVLVHVLVRLDRENLHPGSTRAVSFTECKERSDWVPCPNPSSRLTARMSFTQSASHVTALCFCIRCASVYDSRLFCFGSAQWSCAPLLQFTFVFRRRGPPDASLYCTSLHPLTSSRTCVQQGIRYPPPCLTFSLRTASSFPSAADAHNRQLVRTHRSEAAWHGARQEDRRRRASVRVSGCPLLYARVRRVAPQQMSSSNTSRKRLGGGAISISPSTSSPSKPNRSHSNESRAARPSLAAHGRFAGGA
mmetsp:Transcript_36654/g.85611  ORF Transcript_36654/g.85611 Transcript_36654/m.85611 type:complete len:259 (-) Transcript_36654:213-989(-)